MSVKLCHYDHDGRARFITFCTRHRLPLLTNNDFRTRLAEVIESERRAGRFKLLGWVIMPEHVHLLIVPAIEAEVGRLIGGIKRDSAASIHGGLLLLKSPLIAKLACVRGGKTVFVFWEKRCYSVICRSDKEIRHKIEYCHANPVTRQYVGRPEDWAWSSYRAYQGYSDGPLTLDWVELIGD